MRGDESVAVGNGTPQLARSCGGRLIIPAPNPTQAALRACVAQALAMTHARDAFVALPSAPLSQAALMDDLCALYLWCDRLAVSDGALAVAAAEGAPPVAALAAIMYAARRIAVSADAGDTLFGTVHETRATSSPLAAQRYAQVGSLAAAFSQARAWGASTVAVPRSLQRALDVTSGAPDISVSRLMSASYFGGDETLIRALIGEPYALDEIVLRRALTEAPSTSARPVASLKDIAASLSSGQREAAVHAVATIGALRALAAAANFSLVGAIDRALALLAEHQLSSRHNASDVAQTTSYLRAAAEQSDRVWAAVDGPPPAAGRWRILLDALAWLTVDGVSLVPIGCYANPDAEFIFAGDATRAAGDSLLSKAVDRTAAADTNTCSVIAIDASMSQAVTSYQQASPQASWAWPGPDEQQPVTAGGMIFSASRLNGFVKCSRRWFYEYLCAVLEEQTSMQATYGRVLHAALEALHREVRVPSQHTVADLLQRLLLELDLAFGRSRGEFGSQLEYEVCRQRARRMAEQYVRWLEAESKRAPVEVAHVELLQRFQRGGHQFVGYIDRIDKPLSGGPVTIYDYKTGRIHDDAAAYLEEVRRGDEAQLALYYAMRRNSGDEVGRIALVSLHDPRDRVWILALDLTAEGDRALTIREPVSGVLRAGCSRADLDAAFDELVARCDLLTKVGIAHFDVGKDPPCNFCAYNLACRERPPVGERIFAR